MSGGNTEEFYKDEGTLPKSKMLANLHADCASVVWRYNRWHHHVDYSKFKANQLVRFDPDGIPSEPNNYGLKLIKIEIARAKETPEFWRPHDPPNRQDAIIRRLG